MLHIAVRHQHHRTVRPLPEGDQRVGLRTAVDQEQLALFAHRRDELVHDATRGVAKGVFGLLAAKGLLHPRYRSESTQLLQGGGHSNPRCGETGVRVRGCEGMRVDVRNILRKRCEIASRRGRGAEKTCGTKI